MHVNYFQLQYMGYSYLALVFFFFFSFGKGKEVIIRGTALQPRDHELDKVNNQLYKDMTVQHMPTMTLTQVDAPSKKKKKKKS